MEPVLYAVVTWAWLAALVPPFLAYVYLLARVIGAVKSRGIFLNALAWTFAVQAPIVYMFPSFATNIACVLLPPINYISSIIFNLQSSAPVTIQSRCEPLQLDYSHGAIIGALQGAAVINMGLLALPSILLFFVFYLVLKSSHIKYK